MSVIPRFVPALRPVRLYAKEGESVICERGHFVGYITRDLVYGEALCGDELDSVFIRPGDAWPRCKRCGGLFKSQGKLRFRMGYR